MTYTHAYFAQKIFYLDQLLDRLAPVSSLIDPIPQVRELGTLTVFPTELLLDILERLSIIDLMRFRHCSRYSGYFVDTMLPIHTAFSIAPNTVKGIMALQISTHITAQQLCRKLHQRECDTCGKLAQYLYLPTCLRACFECIPVSVNDYYGCCGTGYDLIAEFFLRPEQLAARPSFRPLPATFTNGMNKFRMEGRQRLYDCPSRLDRAFDMTSPSRDREDVTVVHDPLPEFLHARMATVFAPWPDSTGSRAEQGVFCSLCLLTWSQNRVYTRDTFLEHLRDCRVGSYVNHIEFLRKPYLWLCEDEE
ncbi:hypothetical protein K469DRAFT_564867 [Zopfia rhizophila CBS 207.26]|uniref:F-box domain-containing protein n=1 Tax=Zopfia rhizophila CBS 207.26 TaxID=1314779 RepID=A0A6A6EEK3_9PEZI|nr:hypothetical protein K469DRAFT_564867 [Zopfia rhizophila CBS 207.26]